MSSESILQWLPVARNGSSQALGDVLDACRGYLLHIARQELDAALLAKAGASDLVQETLFDAVRAFPQFHGESEEELLAWLRKLLMNNLISFARRYRDTNKRQIGREMPLAGGDSSAVGAGEISAGELSPSGEAMRREEAEALESAMSRLPEDYRQVLQLRYLEDRSFEEIGQLMQRSASAVRKLWLRAVERLQGEMEASP